VVDSYIFLLFFCYVFFLFVLFLFFFFFFQAEDGIRDATVTGVQTCALPISMSALLGTFVTNDEKSVTVFGIDSRLVVMPLLLSAPSTWSASPCEYGSWKSTITTFLTCS